MPSPRIAPIEPPYSDSVATAFAKVMPEGMPPLELFRVLAVNERVLSRVMAGGLLDRGSIGLRERELIIDRTTARLGSEYEWGVHVAFFGSRAGLTESEIAATYDPKRGSGTLSRHDELLLGIVDELVDTARVSDALFAEARAEFTPPQLVEIVALVGFYHLIAFTTNAFEIPCEPFARRFDDTSRG